MRNALLVLCAVIMLSGCVAALPAVLTGGSIVGGDEVVKGLQGKAERREATIAALGSAGKNLLPRHIEIEDVKKEDGKESWTAETVIGNYRCTVLSGRNDATCSKL